MCVVWCCYIDIMSAIFIRKHLMKIVVYLLHSVFFCKINCFAVCSYSPAYIGFACFLKHLPISFTPSPVPNIAQLNSFCSYYPQYHLSLSMCSLSRYIYFTNILLLFILFIDIFENYPPKYCFTKQYLEDNMKSQYPLGLHI